MKFSTRNPLRIILTIKVLFVFVIFCPTVQASHLVSDLKYLVDINSGTKNIAGVTQIQNWISQRLKKLGFSVEQKKNPSATEMSAPLLLGTLKGKQAKFITLILHADTVFEPSSKFQKFKLSSDGKTAMGPGVIDDKGGILVALAGLEAFLKAAPHPEFSIRWVSSPSEEGGSPGWTETFQTFAEDSFLVLGFEPALDNGSLIQKRRGNRWYQLHVDGKEAHAGRAFKQGVNACAELVSQLSLIYKLTDLKRDTTVSIGRIEGGQDKFNIVCGTADAKIDVRFSSNDEKLRVHQSIEQILGTVEVHALDGHQPTRSRYSILNDSPPFESHPKAHAYQEKYAQLVSETEGNKSGRDESGGSADINFFSVKKDLPLLDGLGPVGGKMHTEEEFIVLSTLETRAEALAKFLAFLNQEQITPK